MCQMHWNVNKKERMKEKLNVIRDVNPNNSMTIEDVIEAEAENENTFDEDDKKILTKNRRVTAMKSCRRLILPKELDDSQEIQLHRLKKALMEEKEEYKERYVDDKKGDIRESDVMKEIKEAKTKLKDDLKGLAFGTTDKSGKFFITDLDKFNDEARRHIDEDEVINLHKVEEIEEEANFSALQ